MLKIALLSAAFALVAVSFYGCDETSTTGVTEPAAAPSFSSGKDKATKYRVHGNYAYVYSRGWDGPAYTPGSVHTYLSVSVNGQATAKKAAYLSYYLSSYTYPCCSDRWYERGYGYIPATDFKGSAHNRITLTTDTRAAANPDFYRYGGPGGIVSLTFQKTDDWERRQRGGGNYMYRSGDYCYRRTGGGGYTEYSAWSSGSVLGVEVPLSQTGYSYGYSYMETQHSTEVFHDC